MTEDRRTRASRGLSHPPVGIAVLAAGASRRLGAPKQLVPYRGLPMLTSVVTQALESRAARVGVVLGAHRARIEVVLPPAAGEAHRPVERLVNSSWRLGLSSSIRVACAWARNHRLSALLIALGDQPLFDVEHADRMIRRFWQTGRLVASVYGGRRCVPAIFPRRHFAALETLEGDRGAGLFLRTQARVVEVPWSNGELDVDEPADLERLRALGPTFSP